MTGKVRNQGLDVLRVLSMCGIVCLHVMNQGGVLGATSFAAHNWLTSHALWVVAYYSVDVFAMLSGYLYITRGGVRPRSLVRLLLDVLLYSAIWTLVMKLLMPELFDDPLNWVRGFLPPLFGYDWYITSYVVVFALIPWLNRLLGSLERKQFQKLIVTIFILLSLIPTLSTVDVFMTDRGYSPWWLLFGYMVGAYLRLYPLKGHRLIFAANMVIVLGVCAVVPVVFDGRGSRIIASVAGYDSVFNVVNAALLVNWFAQRDMRLGVRGAAAMESLSRRSFDVYIVHGHNLVFIWVLKDAFVFLGSFWWCAFAVMGIVALIYVLCYLVGAVKDFVFRRMLNGRVDAAVTKAVVWAFHGCERFGEKLLS